MRCLGRTQEKWASAPGLLWLVRWDEHAALQLVSRAPCDHHPYIRLRIEDLKRGLPALRRNREPGLARDHGKSS